MSFIEVKFSYEPDSYLSVDCSCPEMWEWSMYITIRSENLGKFLDALRKDYQGSPEEMCKAAFTSSLDCDLIKAFCDKNGIEYTYFCGIVM